MDRFGIFDWVRDEFGTEPEYLWNKYPDYAVLRNRGNNKWYGIIMNIPKNKLGLQGEEIVDVLDVKCDKLLIGSLIGQEGFLPAYHMNKAGWISILLDGTVSDEEIKRFLFMSYEMVKPKKKAKRESGH